MHVGDVFKSKLLGIQLLTNVDPIVVLGLSIVVIDDAVPPLPFIGVIVHKVNVELFV